MNKRQKLLRMYRKNDMNNDINTNLFYKYMKR